MANEMHQKTTKENEAIKFGARLSVLYVILGVLGFALIMLPMLYYSNSKLENVGIIGDTVGGILNPIFAVPATILTFLAFWVQYKANEQQKLDLKDQRIRELIGRFEDRFFEMINIHRENVNQINYTKYDAENGKMSTSENRKVYKLIFQEFNECLFEVRRFSNSVNPYDYLHPVHKLKLQSLINKINPKLDIIEFLTIDIAYSIVFYGLSEEGENILRVLFQNKYNNTYYYKLIKYMQLKPKRERKILFKRWEELHTLTHENRILILNQLYNYNKGKNPVKEITEEAENYLIEKKYSKYYGGHQHRLSHYFRHLFQCYKYLSNQTLIDRTDKYFYGKILRAQISTYEQALIFINSITNLGMEWEYTSKYDNLENLHGDELIQKQKEFKFITNYQLIKNLPGSHQMGIKYNIYYPEVKFESLSNY
ncbi:MAG: putative phage abortive infection protein [Flavobacterium sp. JAD_PAG50586_2]|nr:MAG: putative phage abortive infection protein [Flavobacterium sp. JAD_PAG50586_2]